MAPEIAWTRFQVYIWRRRQIPLSHWALAAKANRQPARPAIINSAIYFLSFFLLSPIQKFQHIHIDSVQARNWNSDKPPVTTIYWDRSWFWKRINCMIQAQSLSRYRIELCTHIKVDMHRWMMILWFSWNFRPLYITRFWEVRIRVRISTYRYRVVI